MTEDFLTALRAGTALPATGTAHGHVRLQNGRLARVAYAHEGDATAAGRLQAQRCAEPGEAGRPLDCAPLSHLVGLVCPG